MADLFDMKVGGLGFHLTAHMIALAALFVACFAITGYITFRDNSVPHSAIDNVEGLNEREYLTVTAAPSLAIGTNAVVIGTLPAGARVTSITVLTQLLSVGAATADLDFTIGTVADVDRYVQSDSVMLNAAMVVPYTAVGGGQVSTIADAGLVISEAAEALQVTFTVGDAVLTTAGSYKITVEYLSA